MDNDADVKAAVAGDSTIDVGDPGAEYANDRDVVDTAGLIEAAVDLWVGEIGASLLVEAAAAFRSNEPVCRLFFSDGTVLEADTDRSSAVTAT